MKLRVKTETDIVKKEEGIQARVSKLRAIPEIVYDYESIFAEGQLVTNMTILTEIKTTKNSLRWYCCLRIYEDIKTLMKRKNYKIKDIMELLLNYDL